MKGASPMKRKRGKQNKPLKRVLSTMAFCLFFIVAGFYLYTMYINIEVEPNAPSSYAASRTSQTVKEIQEESKQIADVIEETSTAVVGISKLKDNGNSIFLKDSAKQLGLGTGLLVSEDGYILTNQHVSGAKFSNCYVTLENGKEYTANVVWSDEDLDLSIIKINMKGLSYAKLGDSDKIRVGERVYAIGNPIGFEFQRTVTSGIISAVNRTIKIEEENKQSYMEDLIQTDATINPGNSGGPLITPDGEVIGINSVKITSAEGIGFAIPINIVKPIIDKFVQTGNFEEASIGIFSYDKEVIPYLDSNVEFKNGIYVAQLIPGGAAANAGVKEKDIITKIDNVTLNKMSELRSYIYTKNPGDSVTLLIQRKGLNVPITITLGKK